MAMEGMISPEMADILTKIAVFLLVQALVYLILAKSSNIFSENSPIMRSLSFRTARSASMRRLLEYLSDVPMDGDDASSASSPTYYQIEKSASPKTM